VTKYHSTIETYLKYYSILESMWGVTMKIIFLIALIVVAGCTTIVTETEEQELNYLVSASGVTEPDIITHEITIRAVEDGFSPEEIEVNQGDHVTLYITNMLADDFEKTGKDTDDAKRFGISEYPVEGFYHTGGTLMLKFVADKKGLFEYGDEAHSERRGLLIVR